MKGSEQTESVRFIRGPARGGDPVTLDRLTERLSGEEAVLSAQADVRWKSFTRFLGQDAASTHGEAAHPVYTLMSFMGPDTRGRLRRSARSVARLRDETRVKLWLEFVASHVYFVTGHVYFVASQG